VWRKDEFFGEEGILFRFSEGYDYKAMSGAEQGAEGGAQKDRR
jgi:hypothetical protein